MLAFDHLQHGNGFDVRTEFRLCAAFPQMLIRNAEVFCRWRFGRWFALFGCAGGQIKHNIPQRSFCCWQEMCVPFVRCQQLLEARQTFRPENRIALGRVAQLNAERAFCLDHKERVVQIDRIADRIGSGFGGSWIFSGISRCGAFLGGNRFVCFFALLRPIFIVHIRRYFLWEGIFVCFLSATVGGCILRQVLPPANQRVNARRHLRPLHFDRRAAAFLQHNALAVMRFIAAIRTGYRRRTPAYAILVFEEIRLFGHRACRCFGEILVDAPFAARHIAAAAEGIIDFILRDEAVRFGDFDKQGVIAAPRKRQLFERVQDSLRVVEGESQEVSIFPLILRKPRCFCCQP